ncbi:MAG: S8 family serine peptidase, partial [Candidatus Sericytochromatia bacterium]
MSTRTFKSHCLRLTVTALASSILMVSCGAPGELSGNSQSGDMNRPDQAKVRLTTEPLPGSGGFSIKAGQSDRLANSYIVQLANGANYGNVISTAVRGGAKVRHRFPKLNAFSVADGDPAKLAAISGVLSVTPNYINTVDAGKPGPSPTPTPTPTATPTPAPTQTVPAGVNRIGAAPGNLSFNGSGVGVAVVDSGVSSHRDLTVSASCFSVQGACSDHTPSATGHGSHVSGIVAALNNSTDVVGVAPGATIYPVNVFGNVDSAPDDAVIAGLSWIAANANSVSPAIKVVNMSLGRNGAVGDNPVYRAAIQALTNAGITVVVSAGNTATQTVSQKVPATYPEVLAVASTTATSGNVKRCSGANVQVLADTASYFTTDGAFLNGIGVTVSAPGATSETITASCSVASEGILSTLPGNTTGTMSGTSQAAPHLTGVVALLYQKRASQGFGLTSEEVRAAVRAGADRKGVAPLNSPTSGYTFDNEREGVLSAGGALAALPTPAPTP